MATTVYVSEPSIVHARIGDVLLTQIGSTHTPDEHARFVNALERELSERPASDRIAIIYYVPSGGSFDAVERRRVNEVLDRYLDKRRKTTLLYVLASPSAVTRGVVTAMFWVSRPPYSYRMVANLGAAMDEVANVLPGFDRREFEGEARRLGRALR